ncbi:hypothetical protein AB0M47_30180 [Hamadaea sp. NPDC051192]|uniref:hypothetical protein n=1 Tax=Hamadaea sp. NPDC051192 TaxID=3154940 RepID=UPI0034418E28
MPPASLRWPTTCGATHAQRHLAGHGRGLADAVGVLTYAVHGDQTAYMMRGYKATQPVTEHLAVVSTLTWLGTGHARPLLRGAPQPCR